MKQTDYKEKYERALSVFRARELELDNAMLGIVRDAFDEFQDSGDIKIRRDIRDFILWARDRGSITPEQLVMSDSWISWLERKGDNAEPKSNVADNTLPKFNVGDWIAGNSGSNIHEDWRVCRILKIGDGNYTVESVYGLKGYDDCDEFGRCYHLWGIRDAKDGDVLVTVDDNAPFLFKKTDDGNRDEYIAHCGLDSGRYFIVGADWLWDYGEVKPATKDQRDILFTEMKDAGYEWDAQRKVLIKTDCSHDWRKEVKLVDMGLPSGVKWADRNVGAKSPEDAGLYFSWGNVDGVEFGKACDFSNESYGGSEGAKVDGDLDAEHDAATVNMGGPWRMPTNDEFDELYDNCDWKLGERNACHGVVFTSRINGNSLFLPCSGYSTEHSWVYNGFIGYYWSSSFNSACCAHYMVFDSGGVLSNNYSNRHFGLTVRAVQDA